MSDEMTPTTIEQALRISVTITLQLQRIVDLTCALQETCDALEHQLASGGRLTETGHNYLIDMLKGEIRKLREL